MLELKQLIDDVDKQRQIAKDIRTVAENIERTKAVQIAHVLLRGSHALEYSAFLNELSEKIETEVDADFKKLQSINELVKAGKND